MKHSSSHRSAALVVLAALFVPVTVAACAGGDSEAANDASEPSSSAPAAGELTADEIENGIGPIRTVDITDGVIDAELAARGDEIFVIKCSACHKMDERYVGPALGDVTTKRSGPYVMNMILNPAEMVERHPEARKLLAEYYTPMAFQDVTEEDARALLEYLRQVAQASDSTP